MSRPDPARPWIDHWPWLVKRTWPDGLVTVILASKTETEAQYWADYYNGEMSTSTFYVEKFDPSSLTNSWGG